MEALQAGKQNFAVFVLNVARLGWLLKKSLSPHSRAKNSDISSLGTRSRPLLNESTGRKLTVVNQSKNCQQRKTRGGEKIPGMREIPFGGTQIFFLLPDIADMLAPDL